MYVYVYICMCMCIYVCVCVYMYVYVYICMCMCIYVFICVYMYVFISSERYFLNAFCLKFFFLWTCTPPQLPMSLAALRYLGVEVPLPVNYKKIMPIIVYVCMYVCIYF